MLFSVIVPIYNLGSLVEKCILSLIRQPGNDYEVILIDDGSTDGVSTGICDRFAMEYPHKVSAYHKENGGTGDARNEGIKKAIGEYLCFVDGDDYVTEDYFELLRKKVNESHADIIQFGYFIESNGAISDRIIDTIPNENINLEDWPGFITQAPIVWDRVWKRELFVDHEILFPVNVWYEDLRTVPKVFAVAKNVVSISECIYIYVQRKGSTMHNDNIEKNAEIIDAIEDIVNWYKDNHLFEKYRDYLSKLAVFQILILASARVARVNPKHRLLREFHNYVNNRFPNWEKNPTLNIRKLPRYYKVVLQLVRLRWYRAIQLLYKIKDDANSNRK